MNTMQERPPSSKIPAKAIALIGILFVLAVGGVSAFGYLIWAELGQERQARLAAEALAQSETSARIEAVNAAAHERIARVAAENTAVEEKLAKNAAEREAQRQTQARIEAEATTEAEFARRAEADRARAVAEEEADRQKQTRLRAEEAARKEYDKRASETSARQKAELEANRERSERERMEQALASQEIQAEKELVLELARTRPTIKAIVSGELTFYFQPLPWYAAENAPKAIDEIASAFSSWSPYGATVKQVHNEEDADISVAWVRDYGTHILGESIFAVHIKVGLGSTNCVDEWRAFDANTVKKILWHELGHSMGYGHSDDENNIMYKSAVTRFEVDQEVSEVIAGGWYYTIPLCGSGTYYSPLKQRTPAQGSTWPFYHPVLTPRSSPAGRAGPIQAAVVVAGAAIPARAPWPREP